MNLGGAIFHIKTIVRRLWKESMNSSEYVHYLRKHGVRVGNNVHFRYPAQTTVDLTRPCLIEIGDNVDINANFALMTHDFGSFVFRGLYKDFVNSSGKVKIGNNIVFGRNVTVLKGVEIGDNCIIGAGSVVSKSIPPLSVAVGSPAKVICSIDDYYEKRKSKSIIEAIEYARELAKTKGGIERLNVCDFSEEWVLFLSLQDYLSNPEIQKEVEFRLKGYINIEDFLERPKPFDDYRSFIDEVRKTSG